MTTAPSFWKRLENMVRGRSASAMDVLPPLTPATLDDAEALLRRERPRRGFVDAIKSMDLGSWMPWHRRKRASVTELRENYARVLELIDSLKTHFDAQDRRSGELNSAVTRVAGTLDHLAEVQRQHGGSVDALTTRVDSAAQSAAPLLANLSRVPAALQEQTDTLRTVARRLEASGEAQVQLVAALDRFSQASEALRHGGEAQVEMLAKLNTGDQQLRDALTRMIRQQNRRITALAVFAAVAGVLMLAGLVVALFLLFKR